ncbi:MAG: NADH:ubiquinone reductase (Na(+)-transporting) subunit C [Desulfobacteraceae bacterium]|nr:NADH:ubiquinone reductase (Na(+)-transporting) subunit C [Desulfobacteraceae bacterium]MBC2756890.1 NADH:ubiquinone reductase (Na(+)-transporting) subunit C [Desulfobacteraceae bacterium]
MSDRMKSICFAFALCLVCSVLLTAASTRLKPFQDTNIQTDRKKNILMAISLIDSTRKYKAAEIDRLYNENIFKYFVDQTGTIVDQTAALDTAQDKFLPIYLAMDKQNMIRSYIIPVETRGLWGKIYGYLALQNDGSTIEGFAVYKHSETPGLGGEIETRWFQKNFVGKKIVDQNSNFMSVSVAKGRALDQVPEEKLPNYVDGISGATLTGQYLTRGLQEILSEYEPTSVRFRQNLLQCRMQTEVPWCEK